jgi:RNA polymerase sigma factor (sigma-70 family)
MATLLARRSPTDEPKGSEKQPVDEVLLERFLRGEKSESQEAFRALVVRHGPAVLGICRRVLEMQQDAEDAFQATFLVLARKAGTIRDRKLLASWLYEVAHRVAVKARATGFRRRKLERQVAAMSPRAIVRNEAELAASLDELGPILHAEVDRLPERYRVPIILSYLEGKTNEEVAELLQWPVGTVKGRLSRARDLLRVRLGRRGLVLSAAFLTAILAQAHETAAATVVPSALVEQTMRLVESFGPATFSRRGKDVKKSLASNAGITAHAALLAASVEVHRRVVRFALHAFLIAVIATSTSAVVAASVMTPARSATLRAAVASWIPFRAVNTPPCRDRDRE